MKGYIGAAFSSARSSEITTFSSANFSCHIYGIFFLDGWMDVCLYVCMYVCMYILLCVHSSVIVECHNYGMVHMYLLYFSSCVLDIQYACMYEKEVVWLGDILWIAIEIYYTKHFSSSPLPSPVVVPLVYHTIPLTKVAVSYRNVWCNKISMAREFL